MYAKKINEAIHSLNQGELIIVFDDIKNQNGVLLGLAEKVDSYNVNLMTKIGKGLVCVCITEEKASELNLPLMSGKKNDYNNDYPFTVSVDYHTTTTGISSLERAETIKAFVNKNTVAEDFKMPGHVFPLVSKNRKLLDRINLIDAAVELVEICSDQPVAYTCHILNNDGNEADKGEISELAKEYHFKIVYISDLLKQKNEIIGTIKGQVIKGNQIGRILGFPTANLLLQKKPNLDYGVYGVKLKHNNIEYFGVMNVGLRPTMSNKSSLSYEVHILDFNECIYGENLTVDVCFYIRDEISFPNVTQLVEQIKKDIRLAKQRFLLVNPITSFEYLKDGRNIESK